VIYEEAKDEDRKSTEGDEDDVVRIPAGISEDQKQTLVRLAPEQHYTQPPPRYSEASLVQVLEEYGIGRPSTYAPILSTIQERGYVVREAKRLSPTDTGILVNDLLTHHFPGILDMNFTANMENDLDKIAADGQKWEDVIADFYNAFAPMVQKAQAEMPTQKAELEKVGRECPDCGKDLVIRWGRFGKFISCSGFPACRHTEAWLEKIGVNCPKCPGEIVERKTRKRRVFYGCANYPTCDFTSWKRPINKPCPKCGGLLVISNKREVQCINCSESFLQEEVGEVAAEKA
jgi:DNA topoisomerase-1